MPEFTVELAVGDVLIIGNRTLTVIDIEGSEVHFRVDDEPLSPGPSGSAPFSKPSEISTYRTKAK